MTQAAILAASGSPGTTTGFKNRIINGAMVISQRGTSSVNTTQYYNYITDRFAVFNNVGTGRLTAQQNAGSVTPPTGFTNYLGTTSSSAYTVGATDSFYIYQAIEGYNVADLGWGTANAKTVTLSFWVRSSLTGTFGGSLQNAATDRAYPFTYTISAANTWEQKSVTIAGDTSGTWGTTNGIGIQVNWNLGTGATYSGTAGAWASGFYVSATGATSVVGTNGATFYITGVQLEVGTTATNFDFRSYGTELSLCQRYLFAPVNRQSSQSLGQGQATSSTAAQVYIRYPVEMRAAPSVSWSGTTGDFITLTPTAGFAGNVSAITSGVSSTSIFRADITSSGMTSGSMTNVQSGGPTTFWVFLSAEL